MSAVADRIPVNATASMLATAPLTGLSDEEAQRRRAAGYGHTADLQSSRSYGDIIKTNLFTFINITLVIIGGILVAMGLWQDAIMASGLALVNAAVGVWQEVRAKRRLDRIALLNRASAKVVRGGEERDLDPNQIVLGDVLVAGAGDQILVDGTVVGTGTFDCDESLLTGESDLIPKQSGDHVFSGSFCVVGTGRYLAEKVGADSMANSLATGARTYKIVLTPLEQSVNQIVRILLVIAGFYLAMVLLNAAIWHVPAQNTVFAAAVVVGIVPTGLFLMITVTYSMAAVRLANQNALIQQTNAVESLSNIDVFCMDKTGTLTSNRITFDSVEPISGDRQAIEAMLGRFAASASARNKTSEAIASAFPAGAATPVDEIPFSSARKWSALSLDLPDARGTYALGAAEMLGPLLDGDAGKPPDGWADRGLRILLFATSPEPANLHDAAGEPELPKGMKPAAWLGFSDELRPNSRETIQSFQESGITLKIISGDNPETVAALARQAGFPKDVNLVSGLELAQMGDSEFAQAANDGDIFGRITPDQKERIVGALRARGHYVAMTGDGVNDVLSLKRANLGIAMQSGSQATRAAADIVLLGDSFSALPAAFKEGQRIRRGLQGILSLFLTRVFVVALVILGASVVQAGFPLEPAHLTMLTLLTVGIPTFALAIFAHPGVPPKRFMTSLVSFVLPAALLLAVVGFATYTIVYFLHDVDLVALRQGGLASSAEVSTHNQQARDALTFMLVLGGLWLVIFASPPTSWWAVIEEPSGDWRPTYVALAMIPLYVAIVTVDRIRGFFGVNTLSAGEYLLVGALSVGWALALRYAWKHHLFESFFGYDASEQSA